MNSNKKLLTTLSGLPDDVTILDSKRIGDDIIEIFVKWDEPKGDPEETRRSVIHQAVSLTSG